VNSTSFANYLMFVELMSVFSLIVVLPAMGNLLKWHETSQNVVVGSLSAATAFCMAACARMWPDFYLASMLNRISICQDALTRTTITKCVDQEEVGKVFSAMALIVAIMPLASDPLMKKVYNLTVSTWPQAFVIVLGGMMAAATIAMIILRLRKSAIEKEHAKSVQRHAKKTEAREMS